MVQQLNYFIKSYVFIAVAKCYKDKLKLIYFNYLYFIFFLNNRK